MVDALKYRYTYNALDYRIMPLLLDEDVLKT
jgi:hypothetical protein